MTNIFNQFRVRKTVLEMLRDRGYSISSYDMMDFNQFCEFFPNCVKDTSNLRIVVHKETENEKDKTILAYFADEEKMALKSVKTLLENTYNQGIFHLIIVLREGISPAGAKFVQDCESLTITTFIEKELLLNITHHKLVPKHRIISEIEQKELLKEKMVKKSEMPKILISDPVAKYFGARKGDIFEIERDSETASKIKTWRVTI
ncbi:RNA polymerase, 25-kDa subunit (common to polymerases I, II and III) [Pseudoloma neurophilia]|uniref:DNA-directed RNA polymerases I, II, and III subunit RPABC1 n=1 Tax=Pseudoloma neurophilia TaxID=146866 RepID=A0A0R0M3X8_9MICR|nr:RNA polymerase, 25-kDa subunit (common to polymerases I, II and III) [Pseudoloma neurophilia]